VKRGGVLLLKRGRLERNEKAALDMKQEKDSVVLHTSPQEVK
jgi:hypothetical protein